MARFRGTIQGHRGEASRLGTAKSGLVVTANGWNLGVRAELDVDENGNDQLVVYRTSGSNRHQKEDQLLGTFRAPSE